MSFGNSDRGEGNPVGLARAGENSLRPRRRVQAASRRVFRRQLSPALRYRPFPRSAFQISVSAHNANLCLRKSPDAPLLILNCVTQNHFAVTGPRRRSPSAWRVWCCCNWRWAPANRSTSSSTPTRMIPGTNAPSPCSPTARWMPAPSSFRWFCPSLGLTQPLPRFSLWSARPSKICPPAAPPRFPPPLPDSV